MTWDELAIYFERKAAELTEDVPEIVAETATEYFKQRFTEKEFDGSMWERAKVAKRTGSLLVESGALVNSIQPKEITPTKVVISAGNEKVDYAQVHNEGFRGPVTIPAHTRNTRRGPQNVRTHTRRVNIPQRQFMGESRELAAKMVQRIENYFRSLFT